MQIIDPVEMRKITGAATKARQIDVLKLNRIPFTVRADGWPVTTWDAYNATLSGTSGPASSKRHLAEPDFAAISRGKH